MRFHPFRLITFISQDGPAPWLHLHCDTQRLHSYYGRVRQRAPRRYSTPRGSAAWRSPSRRQPKLTVMSGHAFTGSAREPGPSSCCLYAGHHLGSKRVTPRFIPGWRQDPGFDATCIHFDASDGRGPFPAHRSSSRPTPDVIKPRLFSHRSTPRSSAKAPVSGLRPPPRKAAPEVQNFLHLLVQHRGQRATSTHLPRSCSQRLLKCLTGIAPAPRRITAGSSSSRHRGRRRLQTSFQRACGCTFRRLGFGQSSSRHITRTSRRAIPYAWAWPPVSWGRGRLPGEVPALGWSFSRQPPPEPAVRVSPQRALQ